MPSGIVKIPRITSGSTSYWVGENTNITPSDVKTGQLTLSHKKQAVLVPISNDLIRFSSPNADTIVRDDMVRALAQGEDLAFLSGDGTETSPKGILNWVASANVLTANSSVSLANVTIDLGRCLQAVMDADINLVINQAGTGAIDVRAGWIFSPRNWRYLSTVQTGLGTYAFRDEMLRGTLFGFPYRVTTQIDNSDVIFGCFAHAIIGESVSLMVDSSQEAAYYDGSSVVSPFSQDQTVIRVLHGKDFALRYDLGFVHLDGVTWGA